MKHVEKANDRQAIQVEHGDTFESCFFNHCRIDNLKADLDAFDDCYFHSCPVKSWSSVVKDSNVVIECSIWGHHEQHQ